MQNKKITLRTMCLFFSGGEYMKICMLGQKSLSREGGVEIVVVLTRMETLSRNLFKPFKIKELQFS